MRRRAGGACRRWWKTRASSSRECAGSRGRTQGGTTAPPAIKSSRTDAHPPRLNRQNRTRGKFGLVRCEQPDHRRPLITGPESGQPDQPGVQHALNHRKLPEVFVNRDKYSTLDRGTLENLLITRIAGLVARPRHVVTGPTNHSCGAAGDAAVHEDLHAADPAGNGSTRS